MLHPSLKYLLVFLLCVQSFFVQLNAQTFRFQFYNEYDGMPQKFVYSVNQDDKGYMLFGTDEGLYRYDGLDFTKIKSNDSIEDLFIRCGYNSSNGKIWFGHNKGGISYYENGKLHSIDLNGFETSKINDFTSDSSGNLWALTQMNGVIKIDPDLNVSQYLEDKADDFFYSMELFGDELLIGTGFGLISVRNPESEEPFVTHYDKIPQTTITSIYKKGDVYLIGTEDEGLYEMILTAEDYKVQKFIVPEYDLDNFQIKHVNMDSKGDVWLSTNNAGMLQLCRTNSGICENVMKYNEGDLTGVESISLSYIDREGNLWIASNGSGLIRLLSNYFSFFRLNEISDEKKALSCLPENDDVIWVGSESSVLQCGLSPWRLIKKYSIDEGVPEDSYPAMCLDDEGTLWTGNTRGELLYKKADSDSFKRFDLEGNVRGTGINHLAFKNDMLVVSTRSGVFLIKDFQILKKLSMNDGLPLDLVESSVFDRSGNIWFITKTKEMAYWNPGTQSVQRNLEVKVGEANHSALAFDTNENIWIGTRGKGVYHLRNDSLINFTAENSDLFKNYVSALKIDVKNQVWITHRGGLSRLSLKEQKVKRFELIEGENLDFIAGSISEDSENNLWFGTDNGILRYTPEMDTKNDVPPMVDILSVRVDDQLYDETSDQISLPFKSNYKINFNYRGLSFKEHKGLKFSYALLGSEDEGWSEPTSDNKVVFNRLDPGQYTFKVKAFNEDGVESDEFGTISFAIAKPFWAEWWFYLIVGALAFAIIRYIIVRRERFLKRNQEYLQKELNERTKEVVEQKEILERTNKDITDSIEYAKKIQTAILPQPSNIKEYFQDSFVFYKPRDIVSGDFYWIQETGDYVLLACADCTGHGVPGAFMSLIGSSLLREISTHKEVTRPSIAMTFMDSEINKLLNSKDDSYNVSDGMDVTMVEYNKVTKRVRISSARRPFVVIKDGVRTVYKGDRFSVGGFQDGTHKDFTDHVFDLNPGDRFYLYSDGYVDQFGGPKGKKLKHTGFLSILDEISSLTMTQQNSEIADRFTHWINGHDQIDDIIVVGVEI